VLWHHSFCTLLLRTPARAGVPGCRVCGPGIGGGAAAQRRLTRFSSCVNFRSQRHSSTGNHQQLQLQTTCVAPAGHNLNSNYNWSGRNKLDRGIGKQAAATGGRVPASPPRLLPGRSTPLLLPLAHPLSPPRLLPTSFRGSVGIHTPLQSCCRRQEHQAQIDGGGHLSLLSQQHAGMHASSDAIARLSLVNCWRSTAGAPTPCGWCSRHRGCCIAGSALGATSDRRPPRCLRWAELSQAVPQPAAPDPGLGK